MTISVWAVQIWKEAMLYGQGKVHKVINAKDLGLAEDLSALAMFRETRRSLCNGDLCLDCSST